MEFDLVIAGARVGPGAPLDIGVRDGRIAAMARGLPGGARRVEAGGAFAFAGFVESHIHLDKACILERCPICEGTLAEAITGSAKAKAAFTEADVSARADRVLEMAVLQGTTRLRSFVEVDPRAGLRSFAALLERRSAWAEAIDIDLCAFAQEGLTNERETAELLVAALAGGAGSVGGCPYTDPDPVAHVTAILDLAERFGVPADFHADFDLDPQGSILPEIIAQTAARGLGGRVSVGHVTKLSAMAPEAVARLAEGLARAGVAVSILPATDLFLGGRGVDRLVPRGLAPAMALRAAGVTVSLASNNILNPFTPFGDASLARIANLYAIAGQVATDDGIAALFDMVAAAAARQLGAPHGLRAGGPADIVLLDAPDPVTALRGPAPVLAGWKAGRQTFRRPRAERLAGPKA
ncbi:amidohydrolase family protein (plasmid) [Paroceanicella profunda]|uniref:Amidohydrolase family protein n=1 Tax=Paroceanicella profunda TaxID=2579971 RepID=A0A5B8G2F2_9RHOB|nr:amidohydrolase family protein [Paroceanicella profunda]QDL94254.1 amidohydrolase family protein [Paroceanicella profunda]